MDDECRQFQINHMTEHLSERLKRLCREVLRRLPAGWDEYRTICFGESEDRPTPSPDTIGYASAHRDEEEESHEWELPPGVPPEQCWTITLYREHLALLSDEACRYVIAHELGHAASGLRTGGIVVAGRPYTQTAPGQYEPPPGKSQHEDAADRLALQWEFSEELQQFFRETA